MEIRRLSEINLKASVNTSIAVAGLLSKIETKMAKNNSTYATLVLKDKNKEVEIKWFDFNNGYMQHITKGKVYCFLVKVQPYDKGKDSISLIVDDKANPNYAPFSEIEANPEDFLDREALVGWAFQKINGYIDYLNGYPLYPILKSILDDRFDKFCTHNAANTFHHTGIGGLMVHSASVCELSMMLADYFNTMYGSNFVNKKLLMCGALLHDIGKVEELDFDKTTGQSEYSTLSILESHIIAGIKIISMKSVEMGINSREVDELIHLIASHHGKPEYGSPIPANTIEAKLLSLADDLDATAYRFNRAYEKLEPGQGVTEWSAGQKLSYYKTTGLGTDPEL